jgi:DNA primase large subunit
LAIAISDLAKYPFLQDAAEEVESLELGIDGLENPDLERVLDRAESRIGEALKNNPPKVSYHPHEEGIEIPSYPVAVMLVAVVGNDYLKRRYALAEAIRAHDLLEGEKKKKVIEIAKAFKWNIRMLGGKAGVRVGTRTYVFALRFTNFLRNARSFHETKWKLVNKPMWDGEVLLTKSDVTRLLREEVLRHIEKKLNTDIRLKSEKILERIKHIRKRHASYVKKKRFAEFPKEVVNEAFPSCIRILYAAAKSGRHLSHHGRFTLTSFLTSIGMEPSEVVNLFRSSADFNERMTRYQVEHIAGERGSRTKYKPPTCETLRTHGLCPGIGDECGSLRSPLTYYGRKTRTLKK